MMNIIDRNIAVNFLYAQNSNRGGGQGWLWDMSSAHGTWSVINPETTIFKLTFLVSIIT